MESIKFLYVFPEYQIQIDCRGVFKIVSNIYDRAFLQKELTTIINFCENAPL